MSSLLNRTEAYALIEMLHRVILSKAGPSESMAAPFNWCCDQFGAKRIFGDTFVVSNVGVIKRCTFGSPRVPFAVHEDAVWDRFVGEYGKFDQYYFRDDKAAIHFKLLFGGRS